MMRLPTTNTALDLPASIDHSSNRLRPMPKVSNMPTTARMAATIPTLVGGTVPARETKNTLSSAMKALEALERDSTGDSSPTMLLGSTAIATKSSPIKVALAPVLVTKNSLAPSGTTQPPPIYTTSYATRASVRPSEGLHSPIAPLVEPPPAPHLHHCRLHSGLRHLQPEPVGGV